MKQTITSAMLLFSLPFTASANIPIPEPDVLPLLAAGGVVGLAMYFSRRKK